MTSFSALTSIVILSIPCFYLGAGLFSQKLKLSTSWRLSLQCATFNLLNSLILALLINLQESPDYPWLRFEATNIIVMLLVSFIGWVILRFSKNYLAGDPGWNGCFFNSWEPSIPFKPA